MRASADPRREHRAQGRVNEFDAQRGQQHTAQTSQNVQSRLPQHGGKLVRDAQQQPSDGGDYIDEETGEKRHFDGHLFDVVVFDDTNAEDIFDYIPPQKNNQIFTPKKVVREMVDLLENENPGCFDNPDHTFIDLYMKSGLYITEIVKRLFNSEKMKRLYPDDNKRLDHIFEKQMFGLAPTEIIYRIATAFILGFDENAAERKHNFKLYDAIPAAKEGRLEQELDKVFGK